MRKLCNIAITVLFALVICGPTLLYGVTHLGVSLPPWATSEGAMYLEGGHKDAFVKRYLNLDGFLSKEFQDAATAEIENHIPLKASAMLGTSSLQRSIIAFANLPFGIVAYPTFYGSTTYYAPVDKALFHYPYLESELANDMLYNAGVGAANMAERYPNIRFFYYLINAGESPYATYADQIVPNPAQPEGRVGSFVQGVGEVENLQVLTTYYHSSEEYRRDFYRTDHHWTWRGFTRAYDTIAAAAGLRSYEYACVPVEGPEFSGTYARSGLMMISEPIEDTGVEFPDLVLTYRNGYTGRVDRVQYSEANEAYQRVGYYSLYYDFFGGVESVAGPGEGTALVITNSMGSAVLPYIAENYETTWVSQQVRNADAKPGVRLDDLITQSQAQDVYVITAPQTFYNMLKIDPEFYE